MDCQGSSSARSVIRRTAGEEAARAAGVGHVVGVYEAEHGADHLAEADECVSTLEDFLDV